MTFVKRATKTELVTSTTILEQMVDGKSVCEIAVVHGHGESWVEVRARAIWLRIRSDEAFGGVYARMPFKKGLFRSSDFKQYRPAAKAALGAYRLELESLPEEFPLQERRERMKGELRGLSDQATRALYSYHRIKDLTALRQALSEGLIDARAMNIGPGTYREIVAFAEQEPSTR